MRIFFSFFLMFLLTNCSKPKSVFICGDHVCVNKTEAEQYFEENLSIEVKIIDKKINKELSLVELNLRDNTKGNKKIAIISKKNTQQNIKTLSNNEIKKIKNKIDKKKKEKKIANKIFEEKQKKSYLKNKDNLKKSVNKNKENYTDVCTILKNCSIDEISKYLLEQGKMKDFPDITKRQ